MASMASVLLFSLLSLLSIVRSQDRAPHGLSYQNPTAFSPSAYEFFHPKTDHSADGDSCAESNCSPWPLAATVASTLAHESKSTTKVEGDRLGAGGIAGIVVGLVCVLILAMGAYYIVVTRRANLSKTNSVQPDA
ncbi:hypothetical protein NMG60_11015709 [Bertholletia excelsa]